jgi:hypothetical protein
VDPLEIIRPVVQKVVLLCRGWCTVQQSYLQSGFGAFVFFLVEEGFRVKCLTVWLVFLFFSDEFVTTTQIQHRTDWLQRSSVQFRKLLGALVLGCLFYPKRRELQQTNLQL